jgi:hypothetical protein
MNRQESFIYIPPSHPSEINSSSMITLLIETVVTIESNNGMELNGMELMIDNSK